MGAETTKPGVPDPRPSRVRPPKTRTMRAETVSYVTLLLGVLVCCSSWALAVNHIWPLVLGVGADLVLIGLSIGAARVIELSEQYQAKKREAIAKMVQGASSD